MNSSTLFFSSALLPDGWAEDVRITVAPDGFISEAQAGASGAGAVQISGAAVAGIANVHSHAHQRAITGLTERAGPGADSFWTWRDAMYAYLGNMTPEDLQAIAAQLYVEMLKSGFTSVGEFQYLHHNRDGANYAEPAEMTLACLSAAREVSIGFTALPVLYAFGGFGAKPPVDGQKRFINSAESFLQIVERLAAETQGSPQQNFGIAPHSLRAVDEELLKDVIAGLIKIAPDAPIHIHIAEQMKEVEDCLSWCGKRPVAHLLETYEVDARWCAIHATHLDYHEVAGLAASGAVAGLCPTTEANLGDGIFPANAFLEAGGKIAIGSDSHISVSPAEDLRMLEYSQRLRDRARNVLADGPGLSTGRSLLDRTLRGGAQAINRKTGALSTGFQADIVVLDTPHPALAGRKRDELLDSWIFSGGNECVRDVIAGGRHIIQNRRHPNEDAILNRFRKTLARLKEKAGA
ncbi:MAG: formimidoylglutamate deiminase [Hyphomicrobiales bacterium]